MPKSARYGSWKSPITSDLIVSQSIGLSEVRLSNGNIYWLESRPQEQGRNVVVGFDGTRQADLTPKTFSVRTRVHEYGGGAWTVAGGGLYFSNFLDGRLYRQLGDRTDPEPLTSPSPEPQRQWRFADGVIDAGRALWIGVREDHTGEGKEPVNTIVAVDLRGPPEAAGRILTEGHDFFSSPCPSPDGARLLWLAWDHPNMPWNGTTLYVAEFGPDGMLGKAEEIAGGPEESIFQPEWSPSGDIIYVSDRSGWWNLYRFDSKRRASEPIALLEAEFGQPQWVFGMSTYAFAGKDRLLCTYSQSGLGRVAEIDLTSGALRPLELPFTQFASVRAEATRAAFIGGAPNQPASVVSLDLETHEYRVLKKATGLLDRPDLRLADYLSTPEPIAFPATGNRTAYGLFYPPRNADYAGLDSEKPPLVVRCHGGPTAAALSTLSLGIQFWTSRGIAVLDINYGGSTGFGRAYRDRLHHSWGVVDVDDCISGAKHLVREGHVDGDRAVITGGSAGGYTTLAALVFHDFFAGGASHYGVSDIAALARDTHKFESRYLDWLIGPYPEEESLYRERSPLFHAERLSKPVIFFQGDEDAVVPPNQTEAMVEALRKQGTPVGYLLFSGEQHGFRNADNIKRALDAELYFYSIEVFRTGLTF
ncbi:MAG: prolyl oligopeptidase family serine peptidase [Hyphomicrobiales bacterium]